MSGTAFDETYLEDQVQQLETAMTMFERETDEGVDEELKAFAQKTLPLLRQHLKQARAIHGP